MIYLLIIYFWGVIGNLTGLKYLDLSFNKLYDLSSEKELFELPKNISEIYLADNVLTDLPWKNFKNSTQLKLLDITNNHFEEFGPNLTKMVIKGVDVYFEGKLYKYHMNENENSILRQQFKMWLFLETSIETLS